MELNDRVVNLVALSKIPIRFEDFQGWFRQQKKYSGQVLTWK